MKNELERHRAGAWSALEALEAQDVPRAERILRSLVEDVRAPRQILCPECGLDCTWPGRLEDHLRIVHAT